MLSDTTGYLNDPVISQEAMWNLNSEQFKNFTSVLINLQIHKNYGQVITHYELETTILESHMTLSSSTCQSYFQVFILPYGV